MKHLKPKSLIFKGNNQQKIKEKLTGSRFRWLNEKLYTHSGAESLKYFQEYPETFYEYHEGFSTQVKSWPTNPIDVIIRKVKARQSRQTTEAGPEPSLVIADMGCGEAKLAATLASNTTSVHSFDLVAANEHVTACDIAHVPLHMDSVHAVVFSLSLMGTNYMDFIEEGARILKPGQVFPIHSSPQTMMPPSHCVPVLVVASCILLRS